MLDRLLSGPTILFYHGVIPEASSSPIQALHHSANQFERQIEYLSKHREVITLRELETKLEGNADIDRHQVVLTFDDGFKNNCTIAAPILERYSIKPTLFTSTKHVTEGARFPTYFIRCALLYTQKKQVKLEQIGKELSTSSRQDRLRSLAIVTRFVKRSSVSTVNQVVEEAKTWLSLDSWRKMEKMFSSEELMNWEDVRYLSQLGWDIGSHCHDHAILHDNNKVEASYQLSTSRKIIKEEIGQCDYFAYPNGEAGSICSRAVSEVSSSGYSLGLSTFPGDVRGTLDRFLLPRRLAPKRFAHFLVVLENSVFYRNRYEKLVQATRENKTSCLVK